MNEHNPASVAHELVGPNHKLLSTEDLDKPLPEGAEYWDNGKWFKTPVIQSLFFTYRIPLKPSDRLRQERDRLDELIGIVEAVEQGAEFEVQWRGSGSLTPWEKPLHPIGYYIEHKAPVRLKPTPPAPSSIHWTLTTRPKTEVWVKEKSGFIEYLITAWSFDSAKIDGDWITYEDLHSDWLQRNGDPAGEKVTS